MVVHCHVNVKDGLAMMARIVTCEDMEGNSFSLMEEVRPDSL